MHVITVASLKGGVGKTSTAITLAGLLAEQKKTVHLVDADPQGTATSWFGLVSVNAPWSAEPVEVSLTRGPCTMTIFRTGRTLEAASPQHQAAFLNRDDIGDGAQYVIIDTGPGGAAFVKTACRAADLVIIPIDASAASLKGVSDVIEAIERIPPQEKPDYRILITMGSPSTLIYRAIARDIAEAYPGRLLKSHIPNDIRLKECPARRLPLSVVRPKTRATVAYRDVLREINLILKKNKTSVSRAEQVPA